MINVKQCLRKVLYLDIVLVEIILFKCSVLVPRKFCFRCKKITNLCYVKILRVILISVPRTNYRICVFIIVKPESIKFIMEA